MGELYIQTNVAHTINQSMEASSMDWNRVEGNWKQVKGKVKEKWGQLTDDDLDVISRGGQT